MNRLNRPMVWVLLGGGLLALLFSQQIWHWGVERTEVPPGKFLVKIHKWGTDLEPDMIVAPNDSYKGVTLDVMPEGRHFLNPVFWSYEVHEMVQVPPGKCLVLMRKYGKPLPPGQVLARGSFPPTTEEVARDDVERGILAEPLMPGSYRINPYAYDWKLESAIEVKADEVGVLTLKVGKDPVRLADPLSASYVVPPGFRGVQKDPLPAGTYYLNPYVKKITPVEVRSHRVELADIEFPSRDGFLLKPHVLVEYAVIPAKAPEVLIRLTDEGMLHQADTTLQEQKENELLQKIILPHMRGYARLEGSNFDARDFIITAVGVGDQKVLNNRERLQKSMFNKVKPRCEDVGIEIRAVTLAELKPPPELAQQISERELARVERDKNMTRLGQYKSEQKLKADEGRKEQERAKVEAHTRLIQAKAQATQRKEVETAKLRQELDNAQLKLDAARKQAEATLLNGKAEAAVILLKNEAEVAGLKKAVQGFSSAGLFAQYHIMLRLAPALSEIFASDDSEFAKLFAQYMTQPLPPANAVAKPATVPQPMGTPVSPGQPAGPPGGPPQSQQP